MRLPIDGHTSSLVESISCLMVRGALPQHNGIYAGSLDGKTKKLLVSVDSSATYTSPGYLIFMDGDSLLGQAFDADRLELSGAPFTIADRVGHSTLGYGAFSASGGALTYGGAIFRNGRLTWIDRSGAALDSIGPEGDYVDLRFSPDEKTLAVSLADPKVGYSDIWMMDLERANMSRFTFGPALNAQPIWSPDGSRIAFRSNRNGLVELYEKSAGGGGSDQPLMRNTDSVNIVPNDWSPDGHHIIYSAATPSGVKLWVVLVGEGRKGVRLLQSSSDEIQARFSPDGRLFAYSANESGRYEVYLQTFPVSERKWKVSTNGGYEPTWSRDGREIYYLSEDRKLMAVAVGAGPSFSIPKPLFQTQVPAGVNALRRSYAPKGDGRRFLVYSQNSDQQPNPITVVLNWTAGLKR